MYFLSFLFIFLLFILFSSSQDLFRVFRGSSLDFIVIYHLLGVSVMSQPRFNFFKGHLWKVFIGSDINVVVIEGHLHVVIPGFIIEEPSSGSCLSCHISNFLGKGHLL